MPASSFPLLDRFGIIFTGLYSILNSVYSGVYNSIMGEVEKKEEEDKNLSALRDNIKQKGTNSYYYAHASTVKEEQRDYCYVVIINKFRIKYGTFKGDELVFHWHR